MDFLQKKKVENDFDQFSKIAAMIALPHFIGELINTFKLPELAKQNLM